MKIDLKNPNPGTKCILHGEDGDAEITLRTCSPQIVSQIRQQFVAKKREFIDGRVYEYADVDEVGTASLMYCYCIVDWKGVLDSEGNPIPCTDEMKKTLMDVSPRFFKFIVDKVDELTKAEANLMAEKEKNSSTSPSGSSKSTTASPAGGSIG